ncbi:hypothetical protein [Methylobacterium pseudosasicola]|uniref:Uncharacterized protein n=1 Tax=Methylobacterium pseudosasicola TaxID=582667 RepID=A0A1I4G990_9HYPH|nr:hypothetical protein [Methylobacterium pseudosasicola]SFL26123.1 hypothetical protein SAMN05192568_1002255 [Methylobacterium pseudosasicola]
MPARATRLINADRAGLAALCLLLAFSVSVRVQTYGNPAPPEPADAAMVDLGEGVVLPRAEAVRRMVWTAACPLPVTADFVEPSPHGADTSLAAPRDPSDRVAYVYRGWTLEGPRAAMQLSVLYVQRRAGAVLGLNGVATRHELAVKLVVPAGCGASPEEAMAALRRIRG